GAAVAGQADVLDVREEGVEQRIAAAVAAVLAGIAFQRLACGGVDVLAGEEVGDPDREADDVAAFGLQALGLLCDRHDRAGLGAADATCELGHAGPRGKGRWQPGILAWRRPSTGGATMEAGGAWRRSGRQDAVPFGDAVGLRG